VKGPTELSELLLPGLLCTNVGTNSGEAGCDFNSLVTDVACLPVGSAFATFIDGEAAGCELLNPLFDFGCVPSSNSLVTVKLTEDFCADSNESRRESR